MKEADDGSAATNSFEVESECRSKSAAHTAPTEAAKLALRVCVECREGEGVEMLRAISFLNAKSAQAPAVRSCSCLARCQRGVAVQVVPPAAPPAAAAEEPGEGTGAMASPGMEARMEAGLEAGATAGATAATGASSSGSRPIVIDGITSARAAASLLRSLDVAVDPRLADAFDAARRGDELMAAERPTEALNAYNRAFGLAVASGLGMRWRSRPSSVVRVRQRLPLRAAWRTGRGANAGVSADARTGAGFEAAAGAGAGADAGNGVDGAGAGTGAGATVAADTDDGVAGGADDVAGGAGGGNKTAGDVGGLFRSGTQQSTQPLPSPPSLRPPAETPRTTVSRTEPPRPNVSPPSAERADQAQLTRMLTEAGVGGPRRVSGQERQTSATAAQVRWLSSLLVSRSRVFAQLGAQGWMRGARRAREDAQYAVQLAEVLPQIAADGRRAVGTRAGVPASSSLSDADAEADLAAHASAWEHLAELCESRRDVVGAIYAYEQLLALQPPFSPSLTSALSAKRGMQELVLLSHRRGLEGARRVRREVQSGLRDAARASRERITRRALADAEGLRVLVERDIDLFEKVALDALNRSLPSLLPRAVADLRQLRKITSADINVLQLQILRGDPTASFLRWMMLRRSPTKSNRMPSLGEESSEEAFWLRQQFEAGALPNDPILISSLLAEAKRDPELVTRLITQAKDGNGLDVFTRASNDFRKFV